MTDIALLFDPGAWSADIAVRDGGLAMDDGLMTAMVLSLFTDARARADDALPQAGADRRGWWGDAFNEDAGDGIGSLLWLLDREKLTEATALKARDIVKAATAWFVTDEVAREVIVETQIIKPTDRFPTGALAIGAIVVSPDGKSRQRYDFVWDATARSLATQ